MARFKLGVVGYGNLGKELVRLLDMKRAALAGEGLELVLTCVLGRRGGVRAPEGLNCAELAALAKGSHALEALPGFDPSLGLARALDEGVFDIAAEFTPTNRETGEPGLTHIRECLRRGVHVTTGNKGPVLLAWDELSALAQDRGLLLGVSCTTGGALPTLLNGRDAMAGSAILSMEGILNGTTNYILGRMEASGISYGEALAEAQRAGIAEADPAMDVEGWDTAVKLLIMAKIVMGADLGLADIPVRGITDVTVEDVRRASSEGRRIKLTGRAWREGGAVRAEVAPRALEADDPLSGVSGKEKAVLYASDTMGRLFICGGASDPMAAAAAALRDVVNAWRSGLLRREQGPAS